MKILVKAKPNAKVERIERLDQPSLGLAGESSPTPTYRVWVKEAPIDGRANEAIIKALAKHLFLPRSTIHLVHGATSKQKTFEVDES